jgi:PAS domain S-box-containing protein
MKPIDADSHPSQDTPPAIHPATFRACADGSNDAIMVTDTQGIILYVNPAWERIYGYRRDEALGRTPRLLRSGRHGPEFYEALWRDLANPSIGKWRGEIVNRTKDGREVALELTISPFRDETGALGGYMSLASDLTERKIAESQLRRQDRLATIGLLASGLAHEMGTPLGVARGRVEYLLGETAEGTPEHRALSSVIAQIDRVSQLVRGVLDVAYGASTNVAVDVPLRESIEGAARLLRPRLADTGTALELLVSPDARVRAEPTRLKQVFLQLLLNGVQAIENVPVSAGRERRITVSSVEGDGFWTVSVADTGSGIAPEHFERLFTPFFTTKAGSGLALVTAQQYVHGWGGAMWADGPSPNGASFHLRLPRADDAPPVRA